MSANSKRFAKELNRMMSTAKSASDFATSEMIDMEAYDVEQRIEDITYSAYGLVLDILGNMLEEHFDRIRSKYDEDL